MDATTGATTANIAANSDQRLTGAYKHGDHGDHGRYGDKVRYRDVYRDAYLHAYEESYHRDHGREPGHQHEPGTH